MTQPTYGRVCKCKKGYVSAWDGKCGHCRTKRDKVALEVMQKEFMKKYEALRVGADTIVGFDCGE